jgi:hypothetical protein
MLGQPVWIAVPRDAQSRAGEPVEIERLVRTDASISIASLHRSNISRTAAAALETVGRPENAASAFEPSGVWCDRSLTPHFSPPLSNFQRQIVCSINYYFS